MIFDDEKSYCIFLNAVWRMIEHLKHIHVEKVQAKIQGTYENFKFQLFSQVKEENLFSQTMKFIIIQST